MTNFSSQLYTLLLQYSFCFHNTTFFCFFSLVTPKSVSVSQTTPLDISTQVFCKWHKYNSSNILFSSYKLPSPAFSVLLNDTMTLLETDNHLQVISDTSFHKFVTGHQFLLIQVDPHYPSSSITTAYVHFLSGLYASSPSHSNLILYTAIKS